jgi:xanthine dehydrogenase accessory factor
VLAELELTEDERQRVHTHVGLEIGARTAPEIALSILGAIVRSIRLEGLTATPMSEPEARPLEALDPVCGMSVTIGPDTPHAVVDDVEHWFCGPGCRDRFVQDRVS